MWLRVAVLVSVIIVASATTAYDIGTIYNPLVNATGCGNTASSHVCDPTNILTQNEGELVVKISSHHSISVEQSRKFHVSEPTE